MITLKKLLIATSGALLLAWSQVGGVHAATFTLSTANSEFNVGTPNQGWWSTNTRNSNDNDNYIVGDTSRKPVRNFFTFNLAAFAGQVVTSATLKLQRYGGAGSSTHTLGLFDVSTPASVINQKINNPDPVIYNDLGTGKSYGSYEISTSGDPNEIISFNLNSNAIADINASNNRFFSIGGALLDNLGPGEQFLFGFSGNKAQTLVVNTVPEPSFVLGTLAFSALGAVSVLKRRKQK